jgi:hypothetical protein
MDDYKTPRWLVRGAERIIGGSFQCDVCASAWSAQAPEWIGPDEDGLRQDWSKWGRCWCDPPYTLCKMKAFSWKAIEEAHRGTTVALLIPIWTAHSWFQALKRNGRMHDVIGPVSFAKPDGCCACLNLGYGPRMYLTLAVLGPGVEKRTNGDPIVRPKQSRTHGRTLVARGDGWA